MNLLKIPLFFVIIIIAVASGAFVWISTNQFVDFTVLQNYTPSKPSIVINDEGNEWARFEVDKRDPVALAQVPLHVIQAFLAAEDREFFNHGGISFKGIVRSTLVNIRHLKIVQGASTITQQLVKLLFTDSRRTFKRKIKEQVLSLIVERQCTKEQILEIYLNHVYFGCGIYGISAACQRFFGKNVTDINEAEAALLAGIPRCPAIYCPLLNFERSLKRRNLILNIMHDLGHITHTRVIELKKQPLQIPFVDKHGLAPHVKETLRVYLEDLIGKQQLYTGGLTIQTTINTSMQLRAEQEFKKQFTKLKKDLNPHVDGAFITIEKQTGHIKALIGGFDFNSSKWNRAFQAKRQLGSVFKPFVYATALTHGYTFASLETDEPIEIKFGATTWVPQNYNKKFEGQMTLARALAISNNIIPIKLLLAIGAPSVITLAQQAGIKATMLPYPSLALGCIDVTPLEAVSMFNVFANDGIYVKPYFIKWIKDELGNKIYNYTTEQHRVMDAKITSQIINVLQLSIKRYLSRTSIQLPFEAFGKTGTTNDSRTCWFCGSSPEYTTAIYIGNDDGSSLGVQVFPVWTVFPIWLQWYLHTPHQKKTFSYAPELRNVSVDWFTGKICNDPAKAVSLLM